MGRKAKKIVSSDLPPSGFVASYDINIFHLAAPSEKFWESVYSRNIRKMIGICYRYTSNRQLSEDLAHDAFLKAIDKSSGFEGRGSFDAWLRRIVVNHALQYIRDQKKRIPIEDWHQYKSEEEQSEELNPAITISGQTDFSEEELLEVINDLPDHHRLVFNLYVIDHFTHNQIGEELNISPGTSKSHLARGSEKDKRAFSSKGKRKRRDGSEKRLASFVWLQIPQH